MATFLLLFIDIYWIAAPEGLERAREPHHSPNSIGGPTALRFSALLTVALRYA